MSIPDPLPALRSLDVTPVQEEGEESLQFVVHDRIHIAPQTLAVSPAGYFVLAHLDGQHSCADIQAAFQQQLGLHVPTEQILELVRVLDEALLLHGERFEQAYERRRADFRAAPHRDNRERYPDATALRAEIEELLVAGTAAPVHDVRGLIAPHLDYARGAPCYADAYATLAQTPVADRYVILGTNHSGRSAGVVATTKSFCTPLGVVATDGDFIERLESRLGVSLTVEELDHLWEHSIELQVHILQVIAGDRSFQIVPLLCPNPCREADAAPAESTASALARFADALGMLVAEGNARTVVLAGADLSHIGRPFGDWAPITPVILAELAKAERHLLTLLETRQEEQFLRRIAVTGNPTRICSAGCIYAALRSLPRHACRVLRYHQAVDYGSQTHVTCAAAVIW